MNSNDNDPRPMEAVRALRARGVDTAEALLQAATPEQILAACRRWDGRQGVGPGLLARWIRDGQYDEPPSTPPQTKLERLRDRFDAYALRYPVDSIAEPHRRMIERRWPGDITRATELSHDLCDGDMVVVDATYPVLELECDECGFTAGLVARSLHVLPLEQEAGF
jgi:hypothetical protein